MQPSRHARALVALVASLVGASPCAALTLDWDVLSWPAPGPFCPFFCNPTLGQTYDVDGENVTVAIDDPGDAINTGTGPLGAPRSPVLSAFLNATGSGGQDNLFIKTDGNAAGISITFDFAHVGGVHDLSFSIFDVDAGPPGSYADRITVVLEIGGVPAPATPIVTTGSASTWDGTSVTGIAGSAAPETGAGSEAGSVHFDFGTAMLTSFTIYYENLNAAPADQWIGIGDIDFEIAPEPGSGALVAIGLGLLGAWRRRVRAAGASQRRAGVGPRRRASHASHAAPAPSAQAPPGSGRYQMGEV